VERGFTARRAVGASAARNSPIGTVSTCREFLRKLDLSAFGTSDPSAFNTALDRHTRRLAQRLKPKGKGWGLARKVVNIFLRDCLYTQNLRTAYRLDRAEELMELPLDSITAGMLRENCDGLLTRWHGVRRVDVALNREYQLAALLVARENKIARVHLDALWWSQSRDSA
jgi:hypothetical protein